MLKKMRRRFILAAMAAFAAVMLLLIIGLNAAHRLQLEKSQDEMLERIYEYDTMADGGEGEKPPPISEMPWAGGPEREFVFHFFVVHCDNEGNVKVFGDEHISSVDEATAQSYAKSALERKAEKGYMGEYRYLVREENRELILIFLNVSQAQDSINTMLRLSAVIGFGSLTAVFLLICVLSRPVIRPYIRNMERQKQFVTDAEHELKTPITSISTSADIAVMELGENEWILDIQKQAKRLTGLTNELLMLSRLDEEKPFPEKGSVSLSEAAWETVEPFETRAKASGRKFEKSIEEDIEVTGDAASLQQLISILLDNAIRYSDEDSCIHFDLSCRRSFGACIQVQNTCSQMPVMEDPDRLFDRFYRPDSARNRHMGGSGLGLSIARMIAECHGGEIHVSLGDGGLVTFTALLP